jgi:hypothetical protein
MTEERRRQDDAVGRLLDELANDPALRAEFRRDPTGVVQKFGIDLEESGWDDMTDEELVERVSLSGVGKFRSGAD